VQNTETSNVMPVTVTYSFALVVVVFVDNNILSK